MERINLNNRVALVTGGSRGIGAAIAVRLAAAGARVVISWHKERDRGCEVLGVIRRYNEGLLLQADVSCPEGAERLIGEAGTHFGRLDFLVNNAGVLCNRSLAKLDPAMLDKVDLVNLRGPIHVTRAAWPHLVAGGRIVNLSSIAAVAGFHGQTAYAASKAGLIACTQVWAREAARRRITVNAIAPGVIQTDMVSQIATDQLQRLIGDIPLGRFGTTTEVAGVALFLCSDLADYVTGQVIHVNGGMRV